VSEGTNKIMNMPARNTLVQLLALYTNPESQNAQRNRQTDKWQDYANSRSYCVAVQSAKNHRKLTFCVNVSGGMCNWWCNFGSRCQ